MEGVLEKFLKRIDQLFSREVFGSIILGLSLGKVIEEANAIVVVILVLSSGVDNDYLAIWVDDLFMFFLWLIEFAVALYLYLKWEEAELAGRIGQSS